MANVVTHFEKINEIALESYDLSSVRELSNYEIVSIEKECTVKFACEWNNDRTAHILLSLINNTPNLIEWKLHCTTAAITAFPSGNGQIASNCEEKCMLSWIRPNDIETWNQMESAKLLFSLQLFANNDCFIGAANIKFLAQLDKNEFCTPENPPIHNLIFGSEEAAALLKNDVQSSSSHLSLQTALEVTENSGNNSELQLFNKLTPQYSMINFALDRFHENVAYVQLKLVNNSKRQIIWKLKTNNKCITALPSGSGLVPAFKSVKCMLFWQLPKYCSNWNKVESAKLLINIRIYTETGKLIAENIAKYIVKPNLGHICTTLDNIPTHQIVLISEKVCRQSEINSTIRSFKSTDKMINHSQPISTAVTKIRKINRTSKAQRANNEIIWQ
ncbi:hypothetical protein ACH3XW_32005 [Acanthocheilonema viteae]